MSFFRKHVRGLLRQTFNKTSSEEDSEEYIEQYDSNGRAIDYGDSTLIYERILNGKNGRKVDVPEVYSDKTGLELPIIHLDKFSHTIRAAFSGPDGGLTNVSIYKLCLLNNLLFSKKMWINLIGVSGPTNASTTHY